VKDYRTKFTNNSSCKKNPANEIQVAASDQAVASESNLNQQQIIEPQPTNSENAAGLNQTPNKQMAHDNSLASLCEEFEEEAVEIDCGVVDPTKNPDIQCKVCWDNSSTTENPLLNSCQCDGSVRFIHYECLKYWLKQKMAKKEEPNLISYTWK